MECAPRRALSSPLSSRARRSLPLQRQSTPSARRRPATGRLRGLLRRLLVDVVFGRHAMVSFLSCRSGEACLPPVKQKVKRLLWSSISCFENTVVESSGLLFASHFERTPGGVV